MNPVIPSGSNQTASYKSWGQVAGYFDGDGNVGLEVVKRVLRFKLRFVDTRKPQIESIAAFITRRGINCGSIGKGDKIGSWQAAYRLDIIGINDVVRAAKAMVGYSVKKHAELLIVIDYLEGRITGNQAIEAFNYEVKSGRRRGKMRTQNVPYTRDEGLRLSRLENAEKARAAHAVNISTEVQEQIIGDHVEGALGHIRLSKKYGYSVSVIRRVLRER